jgi:long-chain acyl-CoA synthetase
VPGGDVPWPAALIVVNPAAAAEWTRAHGITYSSSAEMLAMPRLRQAIREEIQSRQAGLPPAARVRRFCLLASAAASGVEAGLSRQRQRDALLSAHSGAVRAVLAAEAIPDPAWTVETLDGAVAERVDA